MKFILRKSTLDDLDAIYNLHLGCFEQSDQWYKRMISQYLLTGYVIETTHASHEILRTKASLLPETTGLCPVIKPSKLGETTGLCPVIKPSKLGETIDSDHSQSVISKKLVGVLLQGNIKPCSNNLQLNDSNSFEVDIGEKLKFFSDINSRQNRELVLATQVADNVCDNFLFEHNLNHETDPSKFHYLDIFVPINENGHIFLQNNAHVKEYYGIVMLCIHEKFRGQGLAKKLIDKHLKSNLNKILCLHTRKSNLSAYNLYQKMGYDHIAYIKNKYFPYRRFYFYDYKNKYK